jgi:hypothetical protein
MQGSSGGFDFIEMDTHGAEGVRYPWGYLMGSVPIPTSTEEMVVPER